MHEPNVPQSRPFSDQIKVCQIGYLPGEAKFAMVTDAPKGDIIVRRASDAKAVLTAMAEPARCDADSGDTICRVDFSSLTEPGTYYLEVPGVGNSFQFRVAPDIFARTFRLAMRSFYGQRCGIAVNLAPDFPEYHYPACHQGDAHFDPSSGTAGQIECGRGWHDAGDYGRYVVNSGITTGSLLWAYELNVHKLGKLNLDIPESGGKIPDFLAEIRWNLDWMLKMQDQDGGVWHKATSAKFAGFVMPQDDHDPVLIIGNGKMPFKTTATTADFAAVCAIAGRVYRDYDPQYAQRCLNAAIAAWGWLMSHPDNNYTNNPEGIRTGGYGDARPEDEKLWAAAELFRTTGQAQYNDYFLQHYRRWQPSIKPSEPQAWPHVENLAMLTYVLSARPEADADAMATIQADLVNACNQIVTRAADNGYRIPLLSREYIWGSNAVVANYAMLLFVADRLSPNPDYRNAALDCLHYLLGRNTFSTSFLTHAGSRWAMNPHHRPSGADGIREPWPGMLVGGPNSYGKTPPARQWLDEQASFQTNEIAINWNAPLVFILAEALP